MSKRRKLSAEFKTKVALETMNGELTLAKFASKCDVNPWARAGTSTPFRGSAGMRAMHSAA